MAESDSESISGPTWVSDAAGARSHADRDLAVSPAERALPIADAWKDP